MASHNNAAQIIPKAAAINQSVIEMLAFKTGSIGQDRPDARGSIKLPLGIDYRTLDLDRSNSDSGVSGGRSSVGASDASTKSVKIDAGRKSKSKRDESGLLNPAASMITGTENMSFDSIIGMEQIKTQVLVGYINRIKSPQLFPKLDKSPAILMYGPPGNGKTYVTRAIIRELNRASCSGHSVVGFQASGSNLGSRFQNETEKNIRILWEAAAAEAESAESKRLLSHASSWTRSRPWPVGGVATSRTMTARPPPCWR